MTQTGGNYTHVGIEFSANVNENVLSKPNYTVKNQGRLNGTILLEMKQKNTYH